MGENINQEMHWKLLIDLYALYMNPSAEINRFRRIIINYLDYKEHRDKILYQILSTNVLLSYNDVSFFITIVIEPHIDPSFNIWSSSWLSEVAAPVAFWFSTPSLLLPKKYRTWWTSLNTSMNLSFQSLPPKSYWAIFLTLLLDCTGGIPQHTDSEIWWNIQKQQKQNVEVLDSFYL